MGDHFSNLWQVESRGGCSFEGGCSIEGGPSFARVWYVVCNYFVVHIFMTSPCSKPCKAKLPLRVLFVNCFASGALSSCKCDMGALSWLKLETLKRAFSTLLGRLVRCSAHGHSFARLQCKNLSTTTKGFPRTMLVEIHKGSHYTEDQHGRRNFFNQIASEMDGGDDLWSDNRTYPFTMGIQLLTSVWTLWTVSQWKLTSTS